MNSPFEKNPNFPYIFNPSFISENSLGTNRRFRLHQSFWETKMLADSITNPNRTFDAFSVTKS